MLHTHWSAEAWSVVRLVLLSSAATASAECAWVLWAKLAIYRAASNEISVMAHARLITWTPYAAYAKRDECESARKDGNIRIALLGEHEAESLDENRKAYQITRCLPDTVDPREPKGK
jgi:hypothetical protein